MNSKEVMEQTAREGYFWTKQDCPVCRIPPTRFLGTRGGRSHREGFGVECEIWSCGTCGLIFPNPMPFPEKGLGQHYDIDADTYFVNHDPEKKNENAVNLVNEAERILGRKGRLLDIGVGRGEIVVAAKSLGWDVEGVEPSQTFADRVEERTGVKIWRDAIEDAAIDDEQFDVVILSAVLEHLYYPDDVIAKIARILKQGGILYLDVPNEAGLFFRVGNLYQRLRGRKWTVNLAPTFSPYHVFGFSPRSVKKLLAKYQLRPEVWKIYGGTSLVSNSGGLMGAVESVGSKAVIALSQYGQMGTYIGA